VSSSSSYDPRIAAALRNPHIRAQVQAMAGDGSSDNGVGGEAPGGEGGPHEHAEYATTGALEQVAEAADTALGAAQAADTAVDQANADLEAHALTAHGLAAHAIDGAFHTGAEVLPTTGQKNALAGTSGTPGSGNRYVTEQDTHTHIVAELPPDVVYDAQLEDDIGTAVAEHVTAAHAGLATDAEVSAAVAAKADASHSHTDGDLPAGLARDAEVTAAIAAHVAAEPHEEPGAAGQAFPVGSVFLSVVSTDPATLLGYGTWLAIAAGRMLVGRDSGDAAFDTAEETGGAATHTHAGYSDHAALTHAGAAVADHSVTQPAAHTDVPTHTHATDSQGAHVHDEFRNSATTGGLDGWAAGDTSTNTPTLTGYDTGSAGGHTHTAQAPAGAVASQPHTGAAVSAHGVTQPSQHAAQSHSAHDSPSHLPPYFVVYAWKRTA
jgi:hypothetical protein